MSNRLLTLMTAALLPPRVAAPIKVAPPFRVNVRATRFWPLAVIAKLPLAIVCPAPVMSPPVQVEAPRIVTAPVPVNVPALNVSLSSVTSGAKLTVPPVMMVSGEL